MRIRLALALAVSAMLMAGCGGDDKSEAPAWVEDAQGKMEGVPEGAPEAFDYKGGEPSGSWRAMGGSVWCLPRIADSPATLRPTMHSTSQPASSAVPKAFS